MPTSTTTSFVNAPPALVARLDERTVVLSVVALSIDVRIVGLASETTMEITFENPHSRALEGELVFPLPDGAALVGYGLDIEGEIVDASLVTKRQGREIFEAEVRKGVDPGLLEHVGGNQFRTRVWPVPAEGRRTVRVTWAAALAGSDDTAVYDLPLRFEAPRRDASDDQTQVLRSWFDFFGRTLGPEMPRAEEAFRLRISVAKSGVLPEIAGELGFTDLGEELVAETTRAEGLPDRVRVALPIVPEGHSVVERGDDDEHHFRVEHLVEPLPEAAATPAAPARVGILWDASLSRSEADLSRDFDLLRALFTRWGTFGVRLFALRETVESIGDFPVLVGECEEFFTTIRDLPYDGGTGTLPRLDPDCDLHLLFTDGLVNFGAPGPIRTPKPLFALCSATVADRALLRHYAETSGGAFVDLSRLDTEACVNEVATTGLSFLGAECVSGEVADLLPAHPHRIVPGRLGIGGRLVSEEAEIVVRHGRPGEPPVTRRYRLRRADAAPGRVAGRLWARMKADELGTFPDRHADELLALGRRHGLVTPNTSLLVLETLDQHLEHDVEPAPSRKRMRAEFIKHRREVERDEEKRVGNKLSRVLGWWRERTEWWDRVFDPVPPQKKEDEDRDVRFALHSEPPVMHASMDMDMSLSDMEVSAGAPAPSPPASAAEPESGAAPSTSPGGGISVAAWDPDQPYVRAMKDAGADGAYDAYLERRAEHGRSPSFYLDCATHLYGLGQNDLARRVLSNVLELDLESAALYRICAYKLATEGEATAAAELLERVLRMRPEEPQSLRDLALVLEETGERARAAELLWRIVIADWDDRFPKVETIALVELNRLLERARRDGEPIDAEAVGIDPRCLKALDVDLRVVLTWDADLTDVDLWVIEPTGEKCFFQKKLTEIGGRLSEDFTQGYGPEEYMIRRAVPGTYRIQANYYGSSQQSLVGPATILATVFRNFGRPDEVRRVVTVRVEEVKEVLTVGEVEVP